MTTRQSLILRKKSGAYLDLSSAPYEIGQNFTVPSVGPVTSIAGGSSANVYGGGSLSNIKYSDRSWTFDIRILSTTDAAVRLYARRVDDFVRSASRTDPLYIEYRPSTEIPEPLWGQYGAAFRYEVIFAKTDLYDDYVTAESRALGAFVSISATIKPFATSKQQLLCVATGGIQEQMVGSTNGVSLGTIVSEATTNKMTNPVFGHSTFGNNWTAGANLTASKNTDKVYMLPGTDKSAKLQRTGAANTYTQSINVGNTNKHSLGVFVKLHGGGALTLSGGLITDIQLNYGATSVQTSAYIALGDGWYWLKYENFDGIASAQGVGVTVVTYESIYLAAVQLEEKTYCTFPCWGDLIGCAWTGTVHDSTSTRTAAVLSIDDSQVSLGSGTIRILWTPHSNSADLSGVIVMQGQIAGTVFKLSYAANDTISFTDGVNTITSAAKAFSSGDKLLYHIVYGSSGMTLYLNGTSIATGATYTPPASIGTVLYIGQSAGSFHTNGAFGDFSLSDAEFTSSQVSNDYANLVPLMAAGVKAGSVPWFWTDDGDGILALDTGKKPLGIAAGITGSAPATTDIRATLSSDYGTVGGVLISNFPANVPIPLSNLLIDSSGTALAGDYGGEHRRETATTTTAQISTSAGAISSYVAREMDGLEVSYLLRLKAASATTLNVYAAFLTGPIRYSDARKITTSTSYRLIRTRSIVLDLFKDDFTGLESSAIIGGGYAATDTGTLVIDTDYTAIVPRDLIVLAPSGSGTMFALIGRDARYATATAVTGPIPTTGDVISLYPAKYNHLQCYVGAGEAVDPLTTYTTTITAIYITPRWALL